MSSPATATSYGSFVDFESHSGAAPETSGSLYLSGAAGSELMRMNVGLTAAGNVTAVGSFIIGSADMSETDLEKLDGITNGTAAANKAVVLDGSKNIATLGTVGCGAITSTGASSMGSLAVGAVSSSATLHAVGAATFGSSVAATGSITAGSSFIIGSADMSETDLEKLDGITNGTAAANKAVVLDGSKNIATLGTVGCGAITSTGASTMGSLSVGAVSSSATLHAVGAATFGSSVAATGSITAGSSFIIGSADMSETDLEKLDGITNGTAAASKALVLDASLNIGTINQLTASAIKVDVLDVNTINSVTTTANDLEVSDRRIVAGSGSTSANADGGGLRIGGSAAVAGHASVLYDHANTALDFNIGGTTEVRLQDGVLRPETNNDVDLGASGAQFKDLYIDGAAYIDQLGEALDANSQNITGVGTFSAGSSTVTSLSVTDGNITNVGDIALDSISADGNDIDITLTDNRSAALEIKESSNVYMSFSTANGEEGIVVKKEMELEEGGLIFDNKELQFATDESGAGASGSLKYVAADDVMEFSGSAANGLSFSGSANFHTYGIQAGQAGFAATTVTSLSVSDGDITNVGDIALDSISADGNDIDLVMTDNRSAALEIKEGSNVYLQFETTNGGEGIFAKKEFEFQAGANMDDDQKFKFATDEGDAGASGSLGYVAASDVFEISGSSANGIRMSGSLSLTGNGGLTYGVEAGASSFTSLTLNDGNITNVGSLACDSILVDDAAVGLDVRFGGNTGLNKLTLTDNLASALDINEGGTSYLKFVTTNGQEEITANKELVLSQGGLVADDQALVFGDDDDGSISFVSAANVVRFDGGSAGLHFNDTSAFGTDGSGKDVSFHGAAANELMKYTAADHTLKFVNASSATILTLGGDATSEFAVDVADGSNNQNKIRAAAFVTYSDERLKTDVAPMQNGLETINNLKAVNFTWKKDGVRDFGFMAQELKKVVPQAVHGSEEGLLGVDYGRLSAILVSAIQEQSAQIASLKKQLEDK